MAQTTPDTKIKKKHTKNILLKSPGTQEKDKEKNNSGAEGYQVKKIKKKELLMGGRRPPRQANTKK